jgi:hypothetical protein
VGDFESTLVPIKDGNKYQKHEPNSYGLKFNCIHDEYSQPLEIFNSSNPEEVIEHFVLNTEKKGLLGYSIINKNKKRIFMNEREKKDHDECLICLDCNNKFDEEKNKKVRHHDHITGKFIKTICSKCN